MVAFVLADAYREKFGGDHIDDTRAALGALPRSGSGGGRAAETARSSSPASWEPARRRAPARPRALLGVAAARHRRRCSRRALGEPIEAFWEREGEAAFREREERVVLEALDGPPGRRRARRRRAGLRARARGAARRTSSCSSRSTLETAWSRVAGSGRPLARDRAAFDALYAEREAVYRAAADATLPRSGIGHRARARCRRSSRSRAASAEGLRLLWATSASGDYPVWLGAGRDRGAVAAARRPSRRFVVSDANVAELLRRPRPDARRARSRSPPGRSTRRSRPPRRVWRALVEQGVTRADHLVAVGGGVVGDLAGFCAATYQRGIPVVQVPTTLVAQVDSAYGGKTGVDLPEAKNYVGAYHQPAAVLVDPADARDAAAARSSPPATPRSSRRR